MRPNATMPSAPIYLLAAVSVTLLVSTAASTRANGHEFSVLDTGAVGDGRALDTAAINRAIDLCAKSGGGTVIFPSGNYQSGTVHLQSKVTLYFNAGAR